jgi:hypothetical protein
MCEGRRKAGQCGDVTRGQTRKGRWGSRNPAVRSESSEQKSWATDRAVEGRPRRIKTQDLLAALRSLLFLSHSTELDGAVGINKLLATASSLSVAGS